MAGGPCYYLKPGDKFRPSFHSRYGWGAGWLNWLDLHHSAVFLQRVRLPGLWGFILLRVSYKIKILAASCLCRLSNVIFGWLQSKFDRKMERLSQLYKVLSLKRVVGAQTVMWLKSWCQFLTCNRTVCMSACPAPSATGRQSVSRPTCFRSLILSHVLQWILQNFFSVWSCSRWEKLEKWSSCVWSVRKTIARFGRSFLLIHPGFPPLTHSQFLAIISLGCHSSDQLFISWSPHANSTATHWPR